MFKIWIGLYQCTVVHIRICCFLSTYDIVSEVRHSMIRICCFLSTHDK